jgi:formiminotetrahydrofolate cyclodeaminase
VFAESKLSDFLEAVAAKTPTPGGGSVSAAVGALGAALGVMAARFSEHGESERALDEVKKGLHALVDQDAEAYGQVNSAMALPKGTEEEKKRRKEALQIALAEAAEVPLKGMALGVRGLAVLADLAPRCNRHLVSDLVGAATFLEAAVLGCGENVAVNAVSLADKARRERLEAERARLAGEAGGHRQKALAEARKIQASK